MRLFILILIVASISNGCRKDPLDGEFVIIQGKWQFFGSREFRKSKASGSEVLTFIPASEFPDKFLLEFKQKGILNVWKNDNRDKKYRLETTLAVDGCSSVENCKQFGFNLNFDDEMQFNIFMNNDTMYVGARYVNLPLQDYQDKNSTYTYLHGYVRTN